MSGKPAARQGDMTQYGGSIVQGSAGVRIGAPTGVACSVCPGGVTSGHPVTGPDGLEIRREYDELGRLIQETAPDGDITRYR
ncbi:RHS repeat domain-containing protein, partial [Escherichia coli]|uniref:RHS repeat domain-containing protein n=1 Tax=Escherichia coli TaxID=562 RepID=UPI0013AFFCE1